MDMNNNTLDDTLNKNEFGETKYEQEKVQREALEKHEVGLVDWNAVTSWQNSSNQVTGDNTNNRNNINQPFQDPRVHRFERANWMEKMKWPLRIWMRGLQNVSKRWVVGSRKEERRIRSA